MDALRHDSLTSRLGDRGACQRWRLWVEDNSFSRLQRNNFGPGTRFNVNRRPGTGLVIDESLLGNGRITPRQKRKGCVLSYESRDLSAFFGTPEIRVRISVGKIIVTPLLRFHSIARAATESWSIIGRTLKTPSEELDVRSAAPLNLRQTAACIEAELDESNLVYATELIGNQRPGRVVLKGAAVMLTVGSQFLRAAGYEMTSMPGEFKR